MELSSETKEINPQSSEFKIPPSKSSQLFPQIFTDTGKKIGPWKKYLDDTPEADSLAQADNLFDLIEQSVIDEDCEAVIDELDIPEESEQKVFETIRLIITLYSKIEKKRYKIGNGWIPLLSRLVKIPSNKLDTYVAFKSIRDNYVPEPGTHGYILHLLLMYHDPELCNLLDTDNFPLNKYTEYWFNSLLAGACVETVLKLLWQSLFKASDSYKIFFIVLSIIITKRAKIFEMKFDAQERIGETIQLFPRFMDSPEMEEIISFADLLNTNTPSFFKEFFRNYLFGSEREKLPKNLPEYLPSSAFQVISNIYSIPPHIEYHYFIADCRSEMMYQFGRFAFKRNFHVDCNLVNNWSSTYLNAALKTMLSMVQDYEVEVPDIVKHICVMGSGLVEDDPCVKQVVSSLLRKNTKYVSVLFGGYHTVHQLLKLKNELTYYLINHVEHKCIFCNPALLQTEREHFVSNTDLYNLNPSKSESVEALSTELDTRLPSKITQRLRQTGKDIKKQFMACVNPRSSTCEGPSKELSGSVDLSTNNDDVIYEEIEAVYGNRSVSTDSDVYGVFNLNEATSSNTSSRPDEIQLTPQFESVLIDDWIRTPGIEKLFKCREILSNKRNYASRLILTNTNIILLRRIDKKSKNKALLILNCPILYILKISGSSKNKNLIIITLDTTGNVSVPYEKIKLLMPAKEKFMDIINEKFGIAT